MNFVEKARCIRKVLKKSGTNPSVFLSKYKDQEFVDGFPKLKVMAQALTGSPGDEVRNYIAGRLSAEQFKYKRDRRTPLEYGCELVLGWLMEDYVLSLLEGGGMHVRSSGCDRKREFLNSSKVSTDSDAEVVHDGVMRKLEMVFDYSLYWRRWGRIDFRDDKFEKIKSERSMVLGVSVSDASGFVYCPEVHAGLAVKYIKNHPPYGNKPARSVAGVDDLLVGLEDIPNLVRVLIRPEEVLA